MLVEYIVELKMNGNSVLTEPDRYNFISSNSTRHFDMKILKIINVILSEINLKNKKKTTNISRIIRTLMNIYK